jgi:hypothetical protein
VQSVKSEPRPAYTSGVLDGSLYFFGRALDVFAVHTELSLSFVAGSSMFGDSITSSCGNRIAKMFRTEPKDVLRNQKLNDHGFAELCVIVHRWCGHQKEVKHALNYAHGNRCCRFDRHDVTGSSRQRGTHLSPSVRRRLLSIPLRREE